MWLYWTSLISLQESWRFCSMVSWCHTTHTSTCPQSCRSPCSTSCERWHSLLSVLFSSTLVWPSLVSDIRYGCGEETAIWFMFQYMFCTTLYNVINATSIIKGNGLILGIFHTGVFWFASSTTKEIELVWYWPFQFHLALVLWSIVLCLLGRALNIFPLSWLVNKFRDHQINYKMMFIMWFSGEYWEKHLGWLIELLVTVQ